MIDITKIPVKELIEKYNILKIEVNEFFSKTVKELPEKYTFQLIPYETKYGTKYSLVKSVYDENTHKIKTRSLGTLEKLGVDYYTVTDILKKQTEMKEIKARIMRRKQLLQSRLWKSKGGQERKLGM